MLIIIHKLIYLLYIKYSIYNALYSVYSVLNIIYSIYNIYRVYNNVYISILNNNMYIYISKFLKICQIFKKFKSEIKKKLDLI